MKQLISEKTLQFILSFLPVILIVGSAIGLFYLSFLPGLTLPIGTSIETAKINVPLDKISTGTDLLALQTQNYLIFEHFESLPPLSHPFLTQAFGVAVWVLAILFVLLMSTFRRYPFILSAGAVIMLLTLSGVNGLNIGGINTNLGLIICLLGLLLPATLIHVFFNHWNMVIRSLVIFLVGISTLIILIISSNVSYPTLLFSENISLMALAVCGLFTVYIGHAFISNIYVLLGRLNRGVGIKISWHLTVFSLLFLGWMALMFIRITGGTWGQIIPLPPFQYLFIVMGVLGFTETIRKTKQIPQPYYRPWVGKIVYLTGFAISILVLLKAKLSVNTPMEDFIEHIFIYSQLGFGFLFFLYLLVNFSAIMNSGKKVENIIYQAPFFPYFHMRLGGLLTLVIFAVYADGITTVQFGAASTNASADYYYSTSKYREASILYENSFERYRRNEKALNAVAHMAFQQNQPTSALNTLINSFNERPNVPDILLLSRTLLHRQRLSDAIFYLEQGLKYYPKDPLLLNNLSLLYSQINRPVDAFHLLEDMETHMEMRWANQIGLQALHQLFPEEEINVADHPPAVINSLALMQSAGKVPSHSLVTDTIQKGTYPINRAILRNQWTASTELKPLQEDLALLDRLLEDQQLLPSEEEELRETGILRRFKEGEINETLKLLKGMAYRFQKSAGYYHAFAASVFTQQMDLEKAAEEWWQAAEKGFSNFESSHLPVLYFGGKEKEAGFIAAKTGISFPDWMNFQENGELMPNDTVLFYQNLVKLPGMLGKEIFPALDQIQTPELRAFFAKTSLIKKGHWLDPGENEKLLAIHAEGLKTDEQIAYLEAYHQLLIADQPHDTKEKLISATGNAYLTPLVLSELAKIEDNVNKYNFLLEASQFNKDPLLWINLVKYSRIIGLDQYASSSLAIMSEWIEPDDLTQLQIDHL